MALIRTCDLEKVEIKEIERDMQLALYNAKQVIVTDTEANKIIFIELNYDDDLMYRVYSPDVKIDMDAEKIIDFDNYLIKDVIYAVENEDEEYCLPTDSIQQILDKARSL